MALIKRILVMCLAALLFNLYLPKAFHGQKAILYAQTTVTEHPLEVRSTPDKRIPETEKAAQKGKGWLWALLGVVVLGGAAAAAGGGSSGGDGSNPKTGSFESSW